MATISQETWDNMPEKEKNEIKEFYIGTGSDILRTEYEELFGKENLQSKPKIKVWSDIEKDKDKILTAELDYSKADECYKLCINTSEFSTKILQKSVATLKIAKLIELGYGGMVTEEEWKDDTIEKWYVTINNGKPVICGTAHDYRLFIAFHTEQQAKEFLSYPENVELIRQYYLL